MSASLAPKMAQLDVSADFDLGTFSVHDDGFAREAWGVVMEP
jgi:hypothetical protein